MLHQIGVGALGPVFRTYEPERDRLVAVKVFRLDITPEQARELADELSKAADAGLFHPSIVEPIGAGVEGTLAYGAEEYVAAESLDVAMREYAPAPIETALPFITQLAGAIDFARAAGVGHGALHPRDIFVTPEEVRATGFGVVEALERIGLRAPVRRPYSAPERIDGGAWSTPADVFSLAAIAFELLTGRRPAGLGTQIGPLPAGTPNRWAAGLHGVLARAMDEDPERRYPSALALASALEAAARGDLSAAGVPLTAVTAAAAAEGDDGGPGEDAGPAYDPEQAPLAAEGDHEDGKKDEELALREQEADDIAWEREDDEAHHRLIVQEMNEPPSAQEREEDLHAPEGTDVESDSDRFIADVAATAPAAAFVDDFREPGDTSSWRRPGDDDPAVVDEPPRFGSWEGDDSRGRLALEPEIDEPAAASVAGDDEWFRQADHRAPYDPVAPAPEPARRSEAYAFEAAGAEDADPGTEYAPARAEPRRIGLAALLLAVGLLGGLAFGYALWGRPPVPGGEADSGRVPTAAGAGESPQPQASEPGDVAQPAAAARTPVTPPPDAPPATGEPQAPPPAAPAARGKLIVQSTPGGAGVTVNGTWRGRTPLTLDRLPFARYQVRIVEPGYTVASETVTLSAGTPERTLSVRLEQQAPPAARGTPPGGPGGQPAARGATAARGSAPAARGTQAPAARAAEPFTGSVYVDSRPRGATVSINGKPVGETPLRVPEMPIGTHVVRLELPDHRIWSSTARVTAGQEVRVTGSLEPIP